MKNNIKKIVALLMCICLVLSFAACSSDDNNAKPDPNSNNVNLNGLGVEFKFSTDCSNWNEVKADSELFRADGVYAANDVQVVYLHFKNHANHPVSNKVAFRAVTGEFKDAVVGIVDNVRAAFSTADEAKSAVEGQENRLSDNYVYAVSLMAESTKTVAFVLKTTAATTVKIRVDYTAIAHGAQTANATSNLNGVNVVNANCFGIVEDAKDDALITNTDKSFKATFSANTLKQGTVVSATVKPSNAQKGSVDYDIAVSCDGKICENDVKVSVLAGYGLTGVEVLKDGAKVESTYDMYGGLVAFTVKGEGKYTVKYSGSADITGVIVQGSEKPFKTFDEAVKHVALNCNDSEIVNLIIFGKANYTVATGEKVYFHGKDSSINTVNIVGGNDTAEIFITKESGSVPSLPYADDGVSIAYSGITFQSENELQEGGEYSRHFDYRGDGDIAFRNCTFLKALATRGPKASVEVDGCVFKCQTYEDTLKGYCYYSIQKIGMYPITVMFTDNKITENWGGINLDWADADFYVSGNEFANITCSKPPIQLSHANTMIVEDNTFTNIKDENVFRFYSGYNAKSTKIINNTIDADYLFQSDKPGAINTLNDFVFEGNTISKNTNLTLGHMANASADSIGPHNYIVDVTKNTIK